MLPVVNVTELDKVILVWLIWSPVLRPIEGVPYSTSTLDGPFQTAIISSYETNSRLDDGIAACYFDVDPILP